MNLSAMSQEIVDDRVLASYQPLLQQNAQDIRASWQRCRDAGMVRHDQPHTNVVPRAELERIYQASAEVRGLALTEMRLLHGHLGQRGFTLTLADQQSTILDCLPGHNTGGGQQTGLAPGHCWPEMMHGTNAVGTAAAAGRIVVVAGEDHYLERYQSLLCIAAPIYAPSGELSAILDATTEQVIDSHSLAYTLGLMHMAAGHVHAELFRRQYGHATVVLLDAGPEARVYTGIALAFNSDGRLLAWSVGADSILAGLNLRKGDAFNTLFNADLQVLRAGIRPPVGFTELVDKQGRSFQATLYLPNKAVSTEARTAGIPTRGKAAKSVDAGPAVVDRDPAYQHALMLAERATTYRVPVLIRGETGTGKEGLARHVHQASGRRGEFVAVNCAAVPENLIEAELFGYVAGAFTGARKSGSAGLVRRADGGTLFLDEIGDMPLSLQARLLRLIDSWQVRPVGGDDEYAVDVQLVTATNRDLEGDVEDKRFRLDLLHRIKVSEIRLPALRERRDFGDIARHLLHEVDPGSRLTEEALSLLEPQRWPGNIRELRNALTRLLIASNGPCIDAAVVKETLDIGRAASSQQAPSGSESERGDAALLAVLAEEHHNVAATARRLEVSRTTIYNRLARIKRQSMA